MLELSTLTTSSSGFHTMSRIVELSSRTHGSTACEAQPFKTPALESSDQQHLVSAVKDRDPCLPIVHLFGNLDNPFIS